MARYDLIYRTLAKRAVLQGGIDVRSFVEQALVGGMSTARVQDSLLQDLETDGPIFGRFFRSLEGAASASISAAARQGEVAGTIDASKELKRLTKLSRLEDVIDNADPKELDDIEKQAEHLIEFTWVAELKKTCHLCLPLHGTTRTAQEWREEGLDPSTIHANEGWTSQCHCRLVRFEADDDRKAQMQPLVRNKIKSETGLKGSKRTARGIAQTDLDRAKTARDKALETLEGRRTMRLMGQSREGEIAGLPSRRKPESQLLGIGEK